MSAHATQAEAHDDPGPHDADTQDHRQVLHDLIHMGADLARFLHGQAAAHVAQQAAAQPIQQASDVQQATDAQQTADAPPAPPSNTLIPDALISLTLAFDRIARAVRRSILLARSLAQPVQPAHAQTARAHTAMDPARSRAAARRRIIREVEDAIQRTASAPNDGRDGPEALQAELRDRLDAPDLDDGISARPTADIISEICRDLGLAAPPGGARPWKRRTPEDIAQLCAEAAAPSGARQPGARQPGTGPHPRRGAMQPTPGPQPDPAALPRAQPGSIHPDSGPPEDPAEILAAIWRHPARVHGRWRPPHPA